MTLNFSSPTILQSIGVNGWSGAAGLGTLKELYLTFQKEIIYLHQFY